MKELHIALSSNERYMPGALVALSSVAVSAKPETALHFHVFTEDVKPGSFSFLKQTLRHLHRKSVVEQHICDNTILTGMPYWAGSRMAAIRCKFAELLPAVDWCLYLDCDVLYLASVDEHFEMRDDDFLAVAAQEQHRQTRMEQREWICGATGVEIADTQYFNSGVMLFNFKRMRSEGVPAKLLQFFESHEGIPSPDQDALNVVLVGEVKIVESKWNRLQVFLDDVALSKCPIVHYVSGIPWSPKLSIVANGRFRLWHAFADKYIWQKEGESCRRCFPWNVLMAKRVLWRILRCPLIGSEVAKVLEKMHKVTSAEGWMRTQVGYDISDAAIDSALGV